MTIAGWLFIFLGVVVLGVVVLVFIWQDSTQMVGNWYYDLDDNEPAE